jgi:hypothetical protein
MLITATPVHAVAEVAIRVHADGLDSLVVPPGTPIDFAVSATLTDSPSAQAAWAKLEIGLIEDADVLGRPDAGTRLFGPGEQQRGASPKQHGAPLTASALLRPNQPVTVLRSTIIAPARPGSYRMRATWRGATALPDFAHDLAGGLIAGLLRPGRVADLRIEVLADAPAIVDSYPPAGAIDGRQPWSADGTDVAGWSGFELVFVGDTSRVVAEDFVVRHSVPGPAPQVVGVSADGSRVHVDLASGIEPSAWTSITHRPSGTGVRVGYLPGDVNGDRRAGAGDIVALIDSLHGRTARPDYGTDTDRNGETDADDLSRLLELLNGLETYPVFLGTSLPE